VLSYGQPPIRVLNLLDQEIDPVLGPILPVAEGNAGVAGDAMRVIGANGPAVHLAGENA